MILKHIHRVSESRDDSSYKVWTWLNLASNSQLCHLLAVCLWARYYTSLSLSFPSSEIETILVFVFKGSSNAYEALNTGLGS